MIDFLIDYIIENLFIIIIVEMLLIYFIHIHTFKYMLILVRLVLISVQ